HRLRRHLHRVAGHAAGCGEGARSSAAKPSSQRKRACNMRAVVETLSGDGVFARVARSIGSTASGVGATLALRFASNLILICLLFPVAFGLLALVTVFMTGRAMFSDVALGPSIMLIKRGDDRDFLDTAWTIQVI